MKPSWTTVELVSGNAEIMAVVEHNLWNPAKTHAANDFTSLPVWERPRHDISIKIQPQDPKAWEQLRVWLRGEDDDYICLSLGDIWHCRPPVVKHYLDSFAKYHRLRALGRHLPHWPVDFTPEPFVEPNSPECHHWREHLYDFADITLAELDPQDLQEMVLSHRFLIFSSWKQLWEATSGCFVNLVAEYLELAPKPVRCYTELPDIPAGQHLILQYKDHIKDYTPLHERVDDYVPGIYLSSEHASFVRENQDLDCHSREARGWYWETDNRERELWLMDDARSLYNAPMGEEALGGSQIVQDGKVARDERAKLVMDLVHYAYEWLKVPHRWQFSSHFWYEDGSILVPRFTIKLDLPSLRRSEAYSLGKVLYYYRNTPVYAREVVSAGPGCGLTLEIDEKDMDITTPAALIREVWRQVFSIRRAWIRQYNRLRNWPENSKRYLRAQTVYRLMGVFLTQEQLHHFRQAVTWLCDRFQIPASERPNIREDWTVSVNRVNDVAERCRRVLAEIEVLERQLEMKLTRQQLTVLGRLVQRLRHRAINMLDSWWRTLAQHLDTQDVEVALQILQLRREQKRLYVRQIQDKISELEDRLRRLADPSYPEFHSDLPTAAYVYGQERLGQIMERLDQEVKRVPIPALIQRLESLRQEFDFLHVAQYNPLQEVV